MALGAFLAGLLLAETEFSLQVESDIAPYRGLLLGLFFMTVGALILEFTGLLILLFIYSGNKYLSYILLICLSFTHISYVNLQQVMVALRCDFLSKPA